MLRARAHVCVSERAYGLCVYYTVVLCSECIETQINGPIFQFTHFRFTDMQNLSTNTTGFLTAFIVTIVEHPTISNFPGKQKIFVLPKSTKNFTNVWQGLFSVNQLPGGSMIGLAQFLCLKWCCFSGHTKYPMFMLGTTRLL